MTPMEEKTLVPWMEEDKNASEEFRSKEIDIKDARWVGGRH